MLHFFGKSFKNSDRLLFCMNTDQMFVIVCFLQELRDKLKFKISGIIQEVIDKNKIYNRSCIRWNVWTSLAIVAVGMG